MGRTASIPYTKENGVASVDVRTEVLKPCRAKGSISCQSLYVFTIFCIIFLIFLFAASTASFILGLYGEELWCSILNSSHSSLIMLLFRFDPLSVIILLGTPYRHMILCLMNRVTTCLVTLV